MDKLPVTEFDGHKDSLVWKMQIQANLVANNWFRAIDGTLAPDAEYFPKAKAVLPNSVETRVVRAIMSLKTVRDMDLGAIDDSVRLQIENSSEHSPPRISLLSDDDSGSHSPGGING